MMNDDVVLFVSADGQAVYDRVRFHGGVFSEQWTFTVSQRLRVGVIEKPSTF